MQAVHMTQTGVSDDEINRTISEKFKSTMAVVENQVLFIHLNINDRFVEVIVFNTQITKKILSITTTKEMPSLRMLFILVVIC